ncbi:MAG: roadblock/LC7 domain-containing protein [Acidobacteriota bacterium]
MIPGILEKMVLDTADSRGALLVGKDGMAIHWLVVDEVADAEECAAWTPALFEQTCRMMANSLGGPPLQITVQTESLAYLIRPIGPDYLVAMLMDPEGDLKAAGATMKQRAADLAAELDVPMNFAMSEAAPPEVPAG